MSHNSDILDTDIGVYTNLHHHSIFSPLDGFSKINDAVQRVKALGMKGFAISDHGNCFSHFEQYNACKKHGVKPIFANETYIAPGSALVKEKVEGRKPAYHILLIAQNDVGYKNLIQLTSKSWIDGKYYKPRISVEWLAKHSEGLIVLQACIGGLVAQLFLEGEIEEAEDMALKFHKIMEGRYYLEMTYTGMEEQDKVNNFFRALHKKHGIPLVITCDSHYTYKHETEYHRALVSINTGGSYKKPIVADATSIVNNTEKDTDESSMFYTPGEYYIKPAHVLKEYFNQDVDVQAFENSNIIADMCNVNFRTGGKIFPCPVDNPDEVLEQITRSYLNEYIVKNKFDEATAKIYHDRLDHELGVISRMEFCDYFIVVKDYVDFARENNILVGPGRGSAAGSLVAFCARITSVDPIKYGLLFERMLNRGRAKLPLIEFPEYTLAEYNSN